MTDQLADLSSRGVSIWLDDLSRDRLTSGSLASLVARDHVAGVTTNPTIFAKAISRRRRAYAGQLHDLWARGTCVARGAARHDHATTCAGPATCCGRPTTPPNGVDGRASIEVDPRLAYDTEATIAEARALWWRVDRPNLFIKIAGGAAGTARHHRLPGRGHQHQRHADLLPDQLRRGDRRLPRRPGAGPAGRPRPVPDRVGGLVLRLQGGHRGRRAAGQDRHRRRRPRCAAGPRSPNARLAYQQYERMLASPRWAALAAAGARPQRPLWASTSVKDPAYPDTRT